MESFFNRYRSITVLLLVILAQLVLVAVQVKNDQDVRLIRVWTVTAVTPVARIVEALRGGGSGFIRNYILLRDAHEENRRLQAELDRLKLDNIYLNNELNMADRAKALAVFQSHTPSRTLAATVIGTGAGTNSKMVLVDRGTVSGVERGMAVVTPDGIVGKVITAYPTASAVLLITDPDFAAGVISQKGQVRGTLKGQGTPICKVDYVPFEEKIEPGEWLYTSGDDRIFPRGFPVGVVKVAHNAQPFQEILVEPSGMARGIEDVLILVEGVHQPIPDTPPASQPVFIGSPPPADTVQPPDNTANTPPGTSAGTEADKLRAQYKDIGAAQGHKFGEGTPGSKPPDFNFKLPGPAGTPAAAPAAGATPQAPAAAPPASKPAVPPGGASQR
ncbi:MAG: rod shape-determining protein MreC [Bryobacteraceae bacterium]|jgi:rod shape-determining protein MreC